MAIERSNRVTCTRNLPGGYWEDMYPWYCKCDWCGKRVLGKTDDPGSAADAARKDGFITVPNKKPSLPSKWACSRCKEKVNAV